MPIRRLMSSPLLHFFALAGFVFAVYAAMNPAPETSQRADTIVLTPEEAGRLAVRFARVWRRPPNPKELENLIRNWVVEEALVREALALGLDRGDGIVRNRLRQKMQFIAEAPVAAIEPDDASLEAYYRENAKRFEIPGQISFRQIMVPPEATLDEINAILDDLRDGANPEAYGTASLLPQVVEAMPLTGVDRVFGDGFGARLKDLAEGQWSGPVGSGYGRHIVRLDRVSPGRLPPLDAVRDRVIAEWRADQTRAARDAFTDALLARYDVDVPGVNEVPLP